MTALLESRSTASGIFLHKLFRLLCFMVVLRYCMESQAAFLPIEVWVRTNSSPYPLALVVDSQGNVTVTGTEYTAQNGSDILTVKYSPAGESLWTNRFDGVGHLTDEPSAIAVDTNGDIIVTGDTYWGIPRRYDYVTIKYSSSGAALWTNYYDNANFFDRAKALAIAPNRDVVVTGVSSGLGTSSDFATIRYSSSGVPLWVSRYNNLSNGLDEPVAVKVAANGNIYVTGFSYRDGGIGSSDYATVAYSSAGAALWTNYYNGPADYQDWATDLVVDENSDVFVTGYSRGNDGDDYATLKYSSAGTVLWTNRYNGPGNHTDQAQAIAIDPSGDVIVTGNSQSGLDLDSSDYATVKYSNPGIPIWTNRFNGLANLADEAKGVTADQSGNVYIIGFVDYMGAEELSDGLVVKYSPSGDTLWIKEFASPPGQTTWPSGRAIGVGPEGAVHLAIAQGTNIFTAKYTDLVELDMALSVSTVEINWPAGAIGWRLETSSVLSL